MDRLSEEKVDLDTLEIYCGDSLKTERDDKKI